ncbi:hypothetical protein [Streptomyces sp. NPDC051662]|uniref:hypothetical protein n=1 Tax=Streptomyces sp. NPDC051662 TaxID=3154750 RepID=UPI0034424B31
MSGKTGGFSGRIERGPMAADVFRENFTQVYNLALRDRRLSRRARGLLGEILSHRDGFGVSMASLLAGGPEGRDALTSALKELEQYGYLHRERERNELGQLGDTVFKITDMPNGLLIGVEAPWETPSEQKPRSEPKSENPRQAGQTQKPRSEPKSDFPAQAEPAQAQPTHKKNTSSCGAEEDLSPARRRRDGSDREREAAAPEPEGADVVVDAYEAAAGRKLLNGTRGALRAQAVELLAAGRPVEWLAARAAEMPGNGWVDLVMHCERSRAPIPGQAGPGRERCPDHPARYRKGCMDCAMAVPV